MGVGAFQSPAAAVGPLHGLLPPIKLPPAMHRLPPQHRVGSAQTVQLQVEMKRLGIPAETPCAVQQWEGLIAGARRCCRGSGSWRLCVALRRVARWHACAPCSSDLAALPAITRAVNYPARARGVTRHMRVENVWGILCCFLRLLQTWLASAFLHCLLLSAALARDVSLPFQHNASSLCQSLLPSDPLHAGERSQEDLP